MEKKKIPNYPQLINEMFYLWDNINQMSLHAGVALKVRGFFLLTYRQGAPKC